VESEGKADPYDETLSRTTSEPPSESVVTEERAVKTRPAETTEKYEVHSEDAAGEESVSAKAREAGRSLRELVRSIGKKTKEVTNEKAQQLRAQSQDIGATTDARDIQHLGDNIEKLLSVFEDTMTEIRKESYDEQERLLVGYRKLLEEQINVIEARLAMARRLKPGA
jgi:hypothetical protein